MAVFRHLCRILRCTFVVSSVLFCANYAVAATSCSGGYYLSGSTCVACPSYESTSGYNPSRYSAVNAPSAVQSVPGSSYYYGSYNGNTSINSCHVFFLVDNALIPNVSTSISGYTKTLMRSYYSPSTGNYNSSTSIQYTGVANNIALHCKDGYANKEAINGMIVYSSLSNALANACTKIADGNYSEDNVTEEPCPKGYYCKDGNKNPCPDGYTTAGTGATSATECNIPTKCSAGYYLNGTTCSPCASNTYSTGGTATSCTPCASGYSTYSFPYTSPASCRKQITLNKNGGSGIIKGVSGTASATVYCYQGQSCDFGSSSDLKLDGYWFCGWTTTASTPASYSCNESFMTPTRSVYYAQKMPDVYIIEGGHSGDSEDVYFWEHYSLGFYKNYDETTRVLSTPITSISVPKRDDCRAFLGYYDASEYYNDEVYEKLNDESIFVVSGKGDILVSPTHCDNAKASDDNDCYISEAWGCCPDYYISGTETPVGETNRIFTPFTAQCSPCPDGYISRGDKTYCDIKKSDVFIMHLTGDDYIGVEITAAGTFYIDWGDGQTDTITNATPQSGNRKSHSYEDTGDYRIIIWTNEPPKGYMAPSTQTSAISFFGNYDRITKIEGSLGAVFPTLTSSSVGTTQPIFTGAFSSFYELSSVPSGLFSGISGTPVAHMFERTFQDCDSLESLPANLFPTFTNNSISNAEYMFYQTFEACENLNDIPSTLFAGIKGTPSKGMFQETFINCGSLRELPKGLFSGISGNVNQSTFSETFRDTDVSSIPADLFSGLTGAPQSDSFYCTFCNTPLGEFRYYNGSIVSSVVSYIPPTFFSGLSNVNYESGPMQDIFDGTGIATDCAPFNKVQYITGFEVDFSGKVSCADAVNTTITLNNNGATSAGTTTLYTKYNTGVYTDSARTKSMTQQANPITLPTKTGWNFVGYYSANTSTATQYVFGLYNASYNGYITNDGLNAGKGYASGHTWYARWSRYCQAGTYFRASDKTCQTCPADYYCEGITGYNYTDADDGKEPCPKGFTSVAGTASYTSCYKTGTTTCAVANPVVAATNASSVNYNTTGNTSVACKIYPEEDYADTGHTSNCIPDIGTCDVIGMNCNPGYNSTQTTSGLASVGIANTYSDYEYIEIEPDGSIECNDNCYRVDKNNGEWDVLYTSGARVRGRSLCSATSGTNGVIGNPSQSNGVYCWCKTMLYKPNAASGWMPAISSWVRAKKSSCNGNTYDTYADCQNECSYECSNYVFGDSNYGDDGCTNAEQTVRTNVFANAKTYYCAPGLVDLTYIFDNGNPDENDVCTYGETFLLPDTPIKTGYIFSGWQLQ